MNRTTGDFLAMIAADLIRAWILMLLWGAIIPSITGWATIGYGQSIGLIVMASCVARYHTDHTGSTS